MTYRCPSCGTQYAAKLSYPCTGCGDLPAVSIVCGPTQAYAVQCFPATAGGHRFIVPACVVALACLVVLL